MVYHLPDPVLVTYSDAGKRHLGYVVFLHADVLLELEKLSDAVTHVEHEDTYGNQHQQCPKHPVQKYLPRLRKAWFFTQYIFMYFTVFIFLTSGASLPRSYALNTINRFLEQLGWLCIELWITCQVKHITMTSQKYR